MASISRRTFIGSSVGGAVGLGLVDSSVAATGPFEPRPLSAPMSLWELPTPALVVDLDALDYNLAKMVEHYSDKSADLRPHIKTHKCPILAKRQLRAGAVGVCAATISEAEVMLQSGIGDVLVTSPIVSTEKITRLVALAGQSTGVSIVVDQTHNVRDLSQAADAAGVRLSVFIDLNVGTDRTGVAMGEPALELADVIRRSRALALGGIQGYAGHLQHLVGWEYRREASRGAMSRALEIKHRLEKAGHDVPVFTGGGTGTYDIDHEIEGLTDVQVGSYLFMDVNYRNVGGKNGSVFDDFRPSLFVLATAISQPARGRITIDAGYKAFATDHEPPVPLDIEGVSYRWAGDEHGILQFHNPSRDIKIGDKLLLIASHCDPTVNLYDSFYPFRDEVVVETWPIAARGVASHTR